jgi:hypothetical protein
MCFNNGLSWPCPEGGTGDVCVCVCVCVRACVRTALAPATSSSAAFVAVLLLGTTNAAPWWTAFAEPWELYSAPP